MTCDKWLWHGASPSVSYPLSVVQFMRHINADEWQAGRAHAPQHMMALMGREGGEKVKVDVFAGRVKVVSVRGLPYIYDIRSGGLGGP